LNNLTVTITRSNWWRLLFSLHVKQLKISGQSQWAFHGELHDIKYHQFCWCGKEREVWSFMGCKKSFITIKLIWHGYLVFSLGICVHETPTKTGLKWTLLKNREILKILITKTRNIQTTLIKMVIEYVIFSYKLFTFAIIKTSKVACANNMCS